MLKLTAPSAIALTLLFAALPAYAQSPFEQQVLDALNLARTDPAAYAETLRQYRGFFHANIVSIPGDSADYETEEGVFPVDEAIGFLGKQTRLAPLAAGDILAMGAADHTAEQGISGQTGHAGADGSNPGQRVQRHGGGMFVTEVIAYGASNAADVVRQLIVDDGVADRGHRTALFEPDLRFAGVSCGPHREYRMMCVIDMGMTADGRNGAARLAPPVRVANRAAR